MVLITGILTILNWTAFAQPTPVQPPSTQRDISRAFLEAGNVLYSNNLILDACEMYKRSLAADADAAGAAANLARCQAVAGNWATARRAWERALDIARRTGKTGTAKMIELHLSQLIVRISHIRIQVHLASKLRNLIVKVDGEQIDNSRLDSAIEVDSGEHKIVVTAPKKSPFKETIRITEPGITVTVTAILRDDPATMRAQVRRYNSMLAEIDKVDKPIRQAIADAHRAEHFIRALCLKTVLESGEDSLDKLQSDIFFARDAIQVAEGTNHSNDDEADELEFSKLAQRLSTLRAQRQDCMTSNGPEAVRCGRCTGESVSSGHARSIGGSALCVALAWLRRRRSLVRRKPT